MNRQRIGIVMAGVWCAGLALALALDQPVTTWVQTSGLSFELKNHWRWLTRPYIGVGRLPGDFLTFSLIAAIWLFAMGRRFWRRAALVLVGGALAATNALVKWIVGRPRPFQGQAGEVFQIRPFVGGWHGLGGANQSFPSGDVTLAAVTAICLCRISPRWRGLWIGLVVFQAAERVAEGAHYPSDVVAAVGLGWLLAGLAGRLVGWRAEADLKCSASGGV